MLSISEERIKESSSVCHEIRQYNRIYYPFCFLLLRAIRLQFLQRWSSMQQQKLEPPWWRKDATKQKLKASVWRSMMPTTLLEKTEVFPLQKINILQIYWRYRQHSHKAREFSGTTVGRGRLRTACHSFYFLHQDILSTLRGIINHNNNMWQNANEILLTVNATALLYPHHCRHPLLSCSFLPHRWRNTVPELWLA